MNKIKLFALVLGFGLLVGISSKGQARDSDRSSLIGGSDADWVTTVFVSSAQISSGPATFISIVCSTGNGSDFAIAYDTQPGPNSLQSDLASFQQLTPALIFTQTSTIVGMQNSISYADNGVRVSTGLYLFKTAAKSGQANVCTVRWRR